MDTQTPQSGPTNLLEENTSLRTTVQELRKEVSQNERIIIQLMERNSVLAEFIRQKMSDILALAKDFRDEYAHYAEFVKTLSPEEANEQQKGSEVRLDDVGS